MTKTETPSPNKTRTLLWLFLAASCAAASPCWSADNSVPGSNLESVHTVIFDNLDDPAAWKGPIYQYGNPATGKGWFSNGVMTVRHSPVGRFHTVSMSRTWEVDPRQGLWVHFRFRIKEMLLGADLYATVSLADQSLVQMGVNGEQHWVMGGKCKEKEFDDELFWGSDAIVGEGHKRTDIRTDLTTGTPFRYTDWNLASFWYEVRDRDSRFVRVFVNGREIGYRDIDAAAPSGQVDNLVRAECLLLHKAVPLTLTFANFTDGDLYANTSVNNGAGIRWLHAFAANTPAKPHRSDPAKAEVKDSDMEFDFVLIHPPGELPLLPEKLRSLPWPAPALPPTQQTGGTVPHRSQP